MKRSVLQSLIGKTEKEAEAVAAGHGWDTWSILPGQAVAMGATRDLVILEVNPETGLVENASGGDYLQVELD